MIQKETIDYSLRNLKNRKTRSFFTILSILTGIATMFIFISFGLGLYSYIEDISSSSSFDKLVIQPKGVGALDTTFSFSDKELKIIKNSAGVYSATGTSFKVVELRKGDQLKYTYLISFDPSNPLIKDLTGLEINKGRDLSQNDKFIILGSNFQIPNKFFEKPYSLNENIELNGKKIKIIGFYKSVGNPTDDSQIYITNKMAEELFGEDLSYNMIIAKVDVKRMNESIKSIEKNLLKERGLEEGKEDFYVQSFEDLVNSYSTVLNIVIGFIILIALISVLVSSINTANTMVTSVFERKKEIGIIKSIGGKNSDIFFIFLFESSFLGFIAGVLGILLGYSLSLIGGLILNQIGYGFLTPAFPLELFLGSLIFSITTGAISGVIPAIKASKTNPVDTLKYE